MARTCTDTSTLPPLRGPVVPTPRTAPPRVDDAWVAGYEMGRLAAQLAARPVRAKVGLSLRASNRDAAEALARRYDYDLHVRDGAEAEFLWVEFWPRG